MEFPLVSVITVAYNSEATIACTIESVLGQVTPPLEYIIIDGASSDETVQRAESYRSRIESRGIEYRIVSEPDCGIYDAMNKGIAMARGDIIGIINSDDWYEPETIPTVAETYVREAFDLFWASLRIIKPTGNIIKRAKAQPITTRYWNHPTTFITKKVYNRHLYRCQSIYDDWELILRLRREGVRVSISNKILANFRFGGISNEKKLKKTLGRIKEKYSIYRLHGYSRLYLLECSVMELAKYILG